MHNKIWHRHVESVLKGEKRSVLSIVLDNLNTGTTTRARFLAFSPLDRIGGDASNILAILNAELKGLVNDKEWKRIAMESFHKAEAVDQLITRLTEAASRFDRYQNIMDEKTVELKTKLRKMESRNHGPMAARERKLVKLGLVLLESAKFGNQDTLQEYLDCGFPVNFQHPLTGCTALHEAMACNQSDYAERLMDSTRCNYLLRTNVTEDLACDYSYYHCKNSVLADRLDAETMKQAIERGVDIETLFDKRPDYARKPIVDDLSR